MLANCQNNLRRWQMEADLYLGNAESLPFADSSFDVVFTCGGFNFFSDRAKAIREMIRVAKPGGHLMIEDETEEYVKSTYEKIPITSSFYSGPQAGCDCSYRCGAARDGRHSRGNAERRQVLCRHLPQTREVNS